MYKPPDTLLTALLTICMLTILGSVPHARTNESGHWGWRHEDRIRRHWDRSTVETVEGRILALHKSVHGERLTYGIHLLLETENTELSVHLGPAWYLEGLKLSFEEGDRIEVTGSRIELGGEPALIAAHIQRGSERLHLRNRESGIPAWSHWRRAGTRAGDCRIGGTVRDTSGASIPGAAVLLEPENESASTNTDGTFCFSEPVMNEVESIMATAAGFQEERISSFAPSAATPVQVNFVLSPAVVSEMVTVTSATRTSKRLEQVPVRTEVVLPELIEFSGARNLADAVEFMSGIRVENNCQNCNFSQIRLLGMEGPYTQILVDGLPTLSSLAQVYGVEQIPAGMVERLEVVKGGGSAVYGPGSVGGVINVITRTPARTRGFVTGQAGWMNGLPNQSAGTTADWVSSDGMKTATIFGQLDRISPLDRDGDGFTELGERDFGALGARYRQNFFEQKGELVVDFNHIREDRRGGNRLDLPPDQADIAEAVDSRRYAGGVSWRHTPSDKFDYQLALSLAHTNRDTYYGSGRDPNAFGETRNPLWVVDAQFNHFLSSHILSWGGQLTSDSIEDFQPAYDRTFDETYRNVGFFVQDDWFFLPGWELVYGARVDKHTEIDHAIVSPRVALMWSPLTTLSVRTSLARGFLPPQVFNEDLHITQVGGEGQLIRNSADLAEEKSTTFTTGLEWTPRWGSGVSLIEVNLFHTRMQDLFNVVEDDDPATDPFEFSRVNQGSARVYGLEGNLGYALSRTLELQFGYVVQRSRFDDPEPDFGSSDFFRTPDQYGTATAIWRITELFDLFAGARFTGEMKVPHYAGYIPEDRLEKTPAHWTFDASLSRSFPFGADSSLVATLGGKNLTDYYQDDLDQGPNRDSGYVWGPRFPRTIYISTDLEF